MASSGSELDWKLRWPAGAERIEVWDGRVVFEVRGISKTEWTDEDVLAAERCYPGQRVTLSTSRALLFVEPPSAGRGASRDSYQLDRPVTASEDTAVVGAPRPARTVLRVSADQVDAARALVRLRGGSDRVDPLIRKVAAARPLSAREPRP